jgi:hypothetical protein
MHQETEMELRRALSRAFFLSFPLILVMAIYIMCDPFKVIWSYDFRNFY